ncbi:Translation initiation inhibitor [Caballeronia sordidicola]|uniref:Translation initiation inhibitor n=1 Tax=Caballeronia sordidicola TaxID=196367 RepID=A0A242M5J3_CABSO|nr:Translation initiation inhibitor [Caballeronia sordidicola]
MVRNSTRPGIFN